MQAEREDGPEPGLDGEREKESEGPAMVLKQLARLRDEAKKARFGLMASPRGNRPAGQLCLGS